MFVAYELSVKFLAEFYGVCRLCELEALFYMVCLSSIRDVCVDIIGNYHSRLLLGFV